MNNPFLGSVTGDPNVNVIVRVNVRDLPGTLNVGIRFQVVAGSANNLPILEVQPDRSGTSINGKVYQWFRMQFPNGRDGWVRDDLVSVVGDGTPFGYPYLQRMSYAFDLLRLLLPDDDSIYPNPPVLLPGDGAPQPEPTPIPTPPPPPPDVFGTVISNNGLRLRDAPVSGQIKAVLPYHAEVKVIAAQPQGGTSNYIWAKVEAPQGTGWVRTDYLSLRGDGSRFGLGKGDEYPAPLRGGYWWTRGYNQRQNPGEGDHTGWDMAAASGTPIVCGTNGAFVARLITCSRCTPTHPNTLSQGIPLDSPSVFLDAAWGYGYGNAVLLRYLNAQLPASTRDRLSARGLAGAHLYVMYAHLSSINVQNRVTLSANQQIGVIGNTGNSSATHLHLEVRASFNTDDTDWGGMRARLLDPEILYLR